MNMKLVGAMPIKPHLLKFVEYTEQIQPGEFLDVRRNSLICHQLRLLLTNKTNANLHRIKENKKKQYCDTLRFKISADAFDRNDFYFTFNSVVLFNHSVHLLLHEFLLQKIIDGVPRKMTKREIILDEMNRMGMDSVTDYETIDKGNYRLRLAKGMEDLRALRPA